MPLTITVDDHASRQTARETGLTVGGAVERAFADNNERRRSASQDDSVWVNGTASSYGHVLSREDGEHAHIEVETNAYRAHRAKAAERRRR